jgi:hypothetical protein
MATLELIGLRKSFGDTDVLLGIDLTLARVWSCRRSMCICSTTFPASASTR